MAVSRIAMETLNMAGDAGQAEGSVRGGDPGLERQERAAMGGEGHRRPGACVPEGRSRIPPRNAGPAAETALRLQVRRPNAANNIVLSGHVVSLLVVSATCAEACLASAVGPCCLCLNVAIFAWRSSSRTVQQMAVFIIVI
jgi:hypothetical protein